MAIVKENGLRYAKLIHVSVENGLTQQSNKVYIMEEQTDGTIKCSYGRVGIYFANKSRKSLGYSSVRGSYWASGSSDKGFLALYDVYHGNQKHITHHDSSCYSLSKSVLDREGYDSVYAHGGADLRNDEFIIYDGKQCTIAYLIEFR